MIASVGLGENVFKRMDDAIGCRGGQVGWNLEDSFIDVGRGDEGYTDQTDAF